MGVACHLRVQRKLDLLEFFSTEEIPTKSIISVHLSGWIRCVPRKDCCWILLYIEGVGRL